MKTLDDFFRKVDVGDCWEWTGARNSGGYGQFCITRYVKPTAHRWLWEQIVGPIAQGAELDHLCRNRACVNPDHLQEVSPRENVRRSQSPSGRNARKSACKSGHPLAGDNLYVRSDGARRCRRCQRRWESEYLARRASA